jgi:hypothetical protein
MVLQDHRKEVRKPKHFDLLQRKWFVISPSSLSGRAPIIYSCGQAGRGGIPEKEDRRRLPEGSFPLTSQSLLGNKNKNHNL